MKNKWTILILCLIAVGAVFLLWQTGYLDPFLTSEFDASQADRQTVDAYNRLQAENPDFVQGIEFFATKEYAKAAEKFGVTLAVATDPAEEAHAKFWLASALVQSRRYPEAIRLWKEVERDTYTYAPVTRAQAVQQMAYLVYQIRDPSIRTEIFKDEPYESFFVDGDMLLSYRNLFDYGASLYPLAYLELSSANWYVFKLLSSTSTPNPQYVDIIREKLLRAAEDIARLRNEPPLVHYYSLYVPSLERRADTLGKMSRLLGNESLGDPEAAFQEFLALASTDSPATEARARMQYSSYLARRFGAERVADIKTLLAPVIDISDPRSVETKKYLATERANVIGNKESLVIISSIDPAFKTYLLSLGWAESDFR